MSEPANPSPIAGEFTLLRPLSVSSGAVCFAARRRASEKRYIVKSISLPASVVQSQALVLSGSKPEAVAQHYHRQALDLCRQAELLEELSKKRGFLPYAAHWMEPTGDGWQVCLAAPQRRSLARELRGNPMTHLGAVELGIELCAALAVCREAGWLYMNLKPENLFRMKNGEWRIGDLGFARLDALEDAPCIQSFYSAPETADALASPNDTVDTYALGLILYQIFNGGRLPFRDDAGRQRWLADQGRTATAPKYADRAMAAILRKACALDPARRYASPDEMGFALLRYLHRYNPPDTPIYEVPQKKPAPRAPQAPVPELPIPEEEALPIPAPATVPEPETLPAAEEPRREERPPREKPPKPPKPRRPRVRKPLPRWPAVMAVCAALLVCLSMAFQKYCVHTIDDLILTGDGTSLTVTVTTDMDESLLTVVCTDNYGNALRLQPEHGAVTFRDLRPGAQCLITLEPRGIHQLKGPTSGTYATPSQTRITHLTAVTGQEPGSAIISFGVEGIDSDSWMLTFSAEGQEERSIAFADHTVVITGLQVGAEYTFHLTAPVDIRLTGETTLTHTASDLVYPQDLSATAYENGVLTVTWKTPKGADVKLWMAHCYDGAGCDLLLESSGNTARFENITPGSVYTIEVTAANMTVGKRIQFEVKAG